MRSDALYRNPVSNLECCLSDMLKPSLIVPGIHKIRSEQTARILIRSVRYDAVFAFFVFFGDSASPFRFFLLPSPTSVFFDFCGLLATG